MEIHKVPQQFQSTDVYAAYPKSVTSKCTKAVRDALKKKFIANAEMALGSSVKIVKLKRE
uniref:Uncharacterized protein n=1 Tax=Oryctolagus cuniculus TaxID=9986 RepID=A0A5F9D4I5_RABIT